MAAESDPARLPPGIALAGTGFGLLALMVSGPFLWPIHTPPITAFWSEWLAGAFGLAAGLALLANHSAPLVLPRTLAIPAVLLVALLLQFAAGRLAFPQLGLLHAVYLLWAGLLLVAGFHLANTAGLPRLAGVLAGAFAAGALVGAVIALAQWLGIAVDVPWIFPRLGGGVYANLGQANHHAHYSWLGIASMFYFRGRWGMPRALLWLAVVLLALGSVVSGSRSVFLYPVILFAALAWARRHDPRGVSANLLFDAGVLLPAMFALNAFGSWMADYLPGSPAMPGARLYETVSGPSVRLALARTAWTVFLQDPWLGQGVGNYSWASFLAAAAHGGDHAFQVAENAHNFVLQGLAEFGAPATVAVLLLLLFWARGFVLARPWGLEQFWCATMLGIGAAHALLEYPLWYTYFLGPIALLLGATDKGGALSLAGSRAKVYLAVVALAGIVILASLRADYAEIETISNRPLAAHPDREQAWRISMERLQSLHRDSLLSPWALLAFVELSEPDRLQSDARLTLCKRGVRFAPARSLLTRCAMQLAIAGRNADAQRLVKSILRAFPGEGDATRGELAAAARKFPEVEPLRILAESLRAGTSSAAGGG